MKTLYSIAFWLSFVGILAFIFDFGFPQSDGLQALLNQFYAFVLVLGLVSLVTRYVVKRALFKKSAFFYDLMYFLCQLFIGYFFIFETPDEHLLSFLRSPIYIKLAVIFIFIREFSDVKVDYKRQALNPAQLFVLSFLTIIFLGSFLLMLPKATHTGIGYLDALFTATSAVCVTGLIVVDTGSYFTQFGQTIIMILIQIGGIGILTFASYFSYFFKGVATYESQLALSDITSSQRVGEVFSTLKYILVITFSIELVAATFIYFSLDNTLFASYFDQVYFSVFHAISAFCNAGFSTLPNSIYEAGFRFNYGLQFVILSTFILGGLGFPIVANVINYFKYRFKQSVLLAKSDRSYKPWVLNMNSRITLVTTASITAVAFIVVFILEYNNTLAEHSLFGKVITALFSAATPRTAGFNSVDTASLAFPTLMLVFLLMWVGASPSSTGGGIKTSTFAIATLNIISLAQGKTRIEIFKRKIANTSVRRAFAIISLSLVVIGLSIMLIAIFDKEKDLMSIAFESFSAYSTVGLSLGITADLSAFSKVVIIFTMFVGRVSMLTIVIAIFKKVRYRNYQYPTEEITIN